MTLYRRNPSKKELALAFLRLLKGSIVSAGEGDRDAARRAKTMGVPLLDKLMGDTK